ncbi:bifunctional biotin--[acetyl-CoA-carboxylase] ligase/biotin operon repressor BirA [Streptococcus moroccensis]|uniref:Bifunctional ligase/repressor BirA n=1 Tax=Streptococcus moroccensis TaxID=1451356 RepID=A0ABT9YTH8_9STRE|nr:bifunctional biotin--[acetyl-CoA-carboxylase] ligase/biotin operon repressor BirA [Streptococcus moroccensis]MDQ0223306.1 BirA family biotin operon repressor/biotin-[acetyl-CoA-carboxylase] ligase [Streptococcus moroccensis]
MKTYQKVYHILKNADNYISGEQLAEQLNLSRTSIWKATQQLEKHGLVIDSIPNRGYRLIEGDLLEPSWLSDQLPFTIHYREDSQSTQQDARQGLEAGDLGDSLYIAPSQTGAKGRFGRQFFAPQQGGIYMSLHLKPMVAFEQMPPYTILVAAATVQAIENLTTKKPLIKWVNDIYLDSKKIAGILTEAVTSVESGLITDIIIGIGLNVYIKTFPEELKDKAGSLFDEQPEISRNQLIAEIWKVYLNTPENQLIDLYRKKSLVLGQTVSFTQNKIAYTGLATEIDREGRLQVETPKGETIWLNSGEVSLSSWTSEQKD